MADIFALLAGEESGGGKITDTKGKQWLPIIENDFRFVSQSPFNNSSNDGTLEIMADTTHIYVCRQQYIHKINIATKTLVATISNPSSRSFSAFTMDDTHIYTVHSLDGIRKFDKVTMTLVTGSTAALTTGTYCHAIEQDATHLYVVAWTSLGAFSLKKIAKSDLSVYVLQSSSIGSGPGSINWLTSTSDATHVYVSGQEMSGGTTLNPIWKFNKSDLTFTSIGATTGNGTYSLAMDNTYIYRAYSSGLQRVPKDFSSGAVEITNNLGFDYAYAVFVYGGKIYVGGANSGNPNLTALAVLDPANNYLPERQSTITTASSVLAFSTRSGFWVDDKGVYAGNGVSKPYLVCLAPTGVLKGYEVTI